MLIRQLLLIGTILLALTGLAFASEFCGLAGDISKKAITTFKNDQAAGLKLFIKANNLCSDAADNAFNLGVAYYRYGHLDKAQQALAAAVQKDSRNAGALNNLAQVILEQQGNSADALRYAEKAVKIDSSAAIQETLARARFATGQQVQALEGLHAALAKSSEKRLQSSYDGLLDSYLAAQVEKVKAGQQGTALANLAKLDFEPKAARTRIQLLVVAGEGEKALAEVSRAQQQNPSDRELRELGDEVAGQVAAGLYADFQAGKTADSAKRARTLAEQYPQVAVLKEASDKLFDALISDVSTIEVPDAVVRSARKSSGSGRTDQLLAGLSGNLSSADTDVDLNVDVDQNIPQGKKAGPYDIAVVIGNRSYSNVQNVDYAERDARIMRQYLTRTMGYDNDLIIYEENAGYAKFNEIFGNDRSHRGRLFNYIKEGQSRVFVYYVGHGAPDLDTGEAYFVPVDANPQYLKTSGYRLKTFYDNLAKLPVKELTVVLDACFSGFPEGGDLFKGISPAMVKVDRSLTGPDNALVFTSGQADQVSTWYPAKRHSLFTYYFLKGLQGESDADNNKQITVAEMSAYLEDKVPWMARKLKGTTQQPQVMGQRDKVLAVLR